MKWETRGIFCFFGQRLNGIRTSNMLSFWGDLLHHLCKLTSAQGRLSIKHMPATGYLRLLSTLEPLLDAFWDRHWWVDCRRIAIVAFKTNRLPCCRHVYGLWNRHSNEKVITDSINVQIFIIRNVLCWIFPFRIQSKRWLRLLPVVRASTYASCLVSDLITHRIEDVVHAMLSTKKRVKKHQQPLSGLIKFRLFIDFVWIWIMKIIDV